MRTPVETVTADFERLMTNIKDKKISLFLFFPFKIER